MAIKEGFIAELKHESGLTMKMLGSVPMDKRDWKPHEKSMSLGRLATHITNNTKWISDIIHIDDFDFMKDYSFGWQEATTNEELLQKFQSNIDKAILDLSEIKDEDFDKIWTVRQGDKVVYQLPKKIAIRGWGFSHQYHHRGQLSVYLRLLDVPVPGMYGPSADEK